MNAKATNLLPELSRMPDFGLVFAVVALVSEKAPMTRHQFAFITLLVVGLAGCTETTSNQPQAPTHHKRPRIAVGDPSLRAPCTATVASPDVIETPEAGGGKPIIVRVGDVICLAPDENEQWQAAAKIGADTPHLKVSMSVSGKMTMLTVINAAPNPLEYRAAMKLQGREGWARTSVVPLFPYIRGFEAWPDPLEAVAVFGFKWIKLGDHQ